jgi:hypothetical protein
VKKKKAIVVPEIFHFMNKWAEDNLFCFTEVPVACINTPEEHLRSRSLDQAHVAELMKSFETFNSKSEVVEVLVIVPPEEELPKKKNFVWAEWHNKLKQWGYQVICGDHSIAALKGLMSENPDEERWCNVLAKVYIARDNDDTVQFAQSWGTTDNVKRNIHRKITFKEMMLETHRLFYALPSLHDPSIGKVVLAKRQATWKSNRQFTLGMAVGQWGQMWQLCKLQGPLWNKIEAIFNGDVVNTRGTFKTPTGMTSFQYMAKIPDEDLIEWLDLVIRGVSSLADFARKCKNYKARQRLREAVAEHISYQHGYDIKKFDWAVAKSKYPNSTDETWIESYVLLVVHSNLTAALPEAFFAQLEERFLDDSEDQERMAANKVKVSFSCQCFKLFNLFAAQTHLFRLIDCVSSARRLTDIQLCQWATTPAP